MKSFAYTFFLCLLPASQAYSTDLSLCKKDSLECQEPADGGDLFEFIKRAHKSGQRLDQQALKDYLSLGEQDQRRIRANKLASEIDPNAINKMSQWIQSAKAALAQTNPRALDMLVLLKSLAASGNQLLGTPESHEKIGEELKQAKSIVSSVYTQAPKNLEARYGLAAEAHRLSKSAEIGSSFIFDRLSQLSEDQSLNELGALQISNATDLKRFYAIVRERRLLNEYNSQQWSDYESAVRNLHLQISQLDEDSPWYQEELADLKTQYLLLQQQFEN